MEEAARPHTRPMCGAGRHGHTRGRCVERDGTATHEADVWSGTDDDFDSCRRTFCTTLLRTAYLSWLSRYHGNEQPGVSSVLISQLAAARTCGERGREGGHHRERRGRAGTPPSEASVGWLWRAAHVLVALVALQLQLVHLLNGGRGEGAHHREQARGRGRGHTTQKEALYQGARAACRLRGLVAPAAAPPR